MENSSYKDENKTHFLIRESGRLFALCGEV